MRITIEATAVENNTLKVWVVVWGKNDCWRKFSSLKVPFSELPGELPHLLQGWRQERDADQVPWDDPPLF